MRYFHTTQANLQIGDMLLPPTVTGFVPDSHPAESMYDPSKVYLWDEGAILESEIGWTYLLDFADNTYEVEPVGELTLDPEPKLEEEKRSYKWCCGCARIIGRLEDVDFGPES